VLRDVSIEGRLQAIGRMQLKSFDPLQIKSMVSSVKTERLRNEDQANKLTSELMRGVVLVKNSVQDKVPVSLVMCCSYFD